jgi:hypothetical protein
MSREGKLLMAKKLFKNLTLSQKTVLYFEEQYFTRVDSKSGKYTVLKSPTRYYFIGKSGAIRVNSVNRASDSFSYTDRFKPLIKAWAEKQDQKKFIEL